MNHYNDLKNRLEAKKEVLEDRLERIRISKRKPHDKNPEEQATERENDEVVDYLGESILVELQQIDVALKRLHSNEYDICESCGENIKEERLTALPYTSVCINCAK